MQHPMRLIGAALAVLVVSCGPSQGQGQAPAASSGQPAQNRTLVVGHRIEPSNLAPKVLGTNGPLRNSRFFNAALSLIDDKGLARPYLAEALPQLNADSWRVFADGRMETTYQLRENLTWQDGTPLTADDFVFAYRVYKDRGLGVFIASPQDTMDAVLAPDPRTVVVQWRSPNPDAGGLTFEELDPLPSHLLEAAFNDYTEGRATGDTFLGSSSRPGRPAPASKCTTWAITPASGHSRPAAARPSAAIASASASGPRPATSTRSSSDEAATLSAILAGGQIDYSCCRALRFEHFVTLKREWEPTGKGTAVAAPGNEAFLFLQQRPEYVGDRGLLDLRVRRALAHAIDRQAINEGVFDGLGTPTETGVAPDVPFAAQVDRLSPKYPFDVNRSAQLMSEAGYTKDAEGFFVDGQGSRFHVDFAVQDASEIERMQQVQSDTWRRAGFDVRTVVMGIQLFTNLETRQTLPGFSYAAGETEAHYLSSQVGSPATRWSGLNRSGWTNPEYDRLYEAWNTTLAPTERGMYVAQMLGLVREGLPGYPLYFIPDVKNWVSSLQGPSEHDNTGFGRTSRATPYYWDIESWTFR